MVLMLKVSYRLIKKNDNSKIENNDLEDYNLKND